MGGEAVNQADGIIRGAVALATATIGGDHDALEDLVYELLQEVHPMRLTGAVLGLLASFAMALPPPDGGKPGDQLREYLRVAGRTVA